MSNLNSLRSRVRPERVIADLADLARLTGDGRGAQRLCWTPKWLRALEWFEYSLRAVGATVSRDAAGNVWGTHAQPGQSLVVLGSHLDSVPDGGRLDGAYGTLAALEILRVASATGDQDLGLAVVAFADEEGARFGPSLGAAGLTGTADPAWADLQDGAGTTLAEAARECGIDPLKANDASARLPEVRAYLELHIEQGPALEHASKRLAVVTATVAMRRERLTLGGSANHAAATPMELRHDALAAAARVITSVRRLASGIGGATGTVAEIRVSPNVWSVTAARVDLVIDMRAPDDASVAAMFLELHELTDSVAEEHGVTLRWEPVRQHGSQRFDSHLVELAERALAQVGSAPHHLLSGAMHDATVMAAAVPSVMLFVPSVGGVSHAPEEHTAEADLELGVEALAALTDLVLEGA